MIDNTKFSFSIIITMAMY